MRMTIRQRRKDFGNFVYIIYARYVHKRQYLVNMSKHLNPWHIRIYLFLAEKSLCIRYA